MSQKQDFTALEVVIFQDDRFMRAYKQLAARLSHGRAMHLLRDIENYLKAVAESRPRAASTPAAAAMVIAVLHVVFGTPLHITDALFDLWCEQNSGDCVECSVCGYRQPAGIPACAACGGKTGEGGIWAKTRAAGAALN